MEKILEKMEKKGEELVKLGKKLGRKVTLIAAAPKNRLNAYLLEDICNNYLVKLNPMEFLGFCKFMGIRVLTDEIDPETKKAVPKDGGALIGELVSLIGAMNMRDKLRVRRILRPTIKRNG